MTALLSVEHLTMRFGGLIAVNDVSLTIAPQTITAVIGPNGAGKTTLFNCLTGFYKPTQGIIKLGMHDVTRLPAHRLARAGIVRTFQNLRLFGGMSVLENLLAAQPQCDTATAFNTAERWLAFFDLRDVANSRADALPYGRQRRLEIARALCALPNEGPRLLCLDEPAAGLNGRESADLAAKLVQLKNDHRLTILLIEHDMRIVMKISDQVHVMDYGCKLAEGDPATVRSNPDVIRAYLGENDDA